MALPIPLAGHCHRVQLMLEMLDLPYETVDLDMASGAHKAPDYLKVSPFGQVPAIDDNGMTLADSNAIITYLEKKYNDGYEWVPGDPEGAAEVQRWLSVAAGEIASGPCAARVATLFGFDIDYDRAKQKSLNLLAVMDQVLQDSDYLAGPAIKIADIAGYSYIAHAPEGGISLEPFPAVRAWLEQIEAHPRFVGMVRSTMPDAA